MTTLEAESLIAVILKRSIGGSIKALFIDFPKCSSRCVERLNYQVLKLIETSTFFISKRFFFRNNLD
ncbi:hypothetical protein DMC47_28500 [Nostoc sp. 3335mG]|nr:hypothetical protein DMC47_28500 [Nostoc sp. 3335mG]